MRQNTNGSISRESVTDIARIQVGRADWTLAANLASAKRRVKIGQIAKWRGSELEWLRVDARKDSDHAEWIAVR